MPSNVLTRLSERSEYKLLLYFLLTFIGAILLVPMILRAYPHSGAERTLLALLNYFGADLVLLNMGLLGVYTAVLVLFYFDHKKRVQGVILSVVSLIALLSIGLSGLFIQYVGLSDLAAFPVGLVIGVILGGGAQLRQIRVNKSPESFKNYIFTNRSGRPVEFRGAERLFKILVGTFLFLTFFESHYKYPTLLWLNDQCLGGLGICGNLLRIFQGNWVNTAQLPVDLLGITLFGGMLWLFLGYDSEKRIFIIGPPGSGKTHLAFALHQVASNQGDYLVWGSSSGLSKVKEEISTEKGFARRNLPAERSIREVGFRVANRGLFPKNIDFDALDYPGEYLAHFPSGIRLLKGELSEEEYIETIREQMIAGDAQKDPDYADKGIDPFATEPASGVDDGPEPTADGGSGSDFDDPDQGLSDSDFEADQPDEDDTLDSAEGEVEAESERSRRRRMAERRYEDMRTYILPRIQKADTLIYLIDLERVTRHDSLWSGNYVELQQEIAEVEDRLYSQLLGFFNRDTDLGPLKTEVYVATKADFYLEDMGEEVTEAMAGDYAGFRNEVNQYLQGNIELTGLLDYSDRPYPVFIKGEEENRRNMDMAGGGPTLYGFKQLLDNLGR